MSFAALPPTQSPPAAGTPAPKIQNDGWFPDVDPGLAREIVRLSPNVTPARLAESLTDAMVQVNQELARWKARHQARAESLDGLPADSVAGESRLVHHYLRAVYHLARADLMEQYRDFDTTAAGDRKADALETSADDARRVARCAVLDILGAPHLTVELI
jgi:hypothetical protein